MDWDREVDFEEDLDESGDHKLRVFQRYRHGLVDFVVIYLCRTPLGWEDLATYDCKHGFAHRDLRFLKDGDKRRTKRLEGFSLPSQCQAAVNEVRQRWRHFYLLYRSVKNV